MRTRSSGLGTTFRYATCLWAALAAGACSGDAVFVSGGSDEPDATPIPSDATTTDASHDASRDDAASDGAAHDPEAGSPDAADADATVDHDAGPDGNDSGDAAADVDAAPLAYDASDGAPIPVLDGGTTTTLLHWATRAVSDRGRRYPRLLARLVREGGSERAA